ncbi:MAG: vanadium-dependent haloperoxidase [Pyrinomonadaceae bacterium]|nr:vanadium-dependent haloperoxidase [Pyrinomonadaceae bacterium]
MVDACEKGPLTPEQRRNRAFRIRRDAALYDRNHPLPAQVCNGDEARYPDRIGSFSKALPHDDLGEVDRRAYRALLTAISTGRDFDFEAVPLGGPAKLANPLAAFAYQMVGPDSHQLAIPPAPAFDSAEEASEMAELYWRALTRDVHFSDYGTSWLTSQAATNLTQFSDFRGPKEGGAVTPDTLFRGDTPGDLVGPFISQFLYLEYPYGATRIPQLYRVPFAGDDRITSYNEWLNIQRGFRPTPVQIDPPIIMPLDPVPRYLRNGRDLGEYVHRDFTYQGYLNAALIMLDFPAAALDPNNPYLHFAKQAGFVTFGAANILDIVTSIGNAALRAAWFQKWCVHRRLRPEAFGGRIHNHLSGARNYPINSELVGAGAPGREVLEAVLSKYGSYLLPQAYAEGTPIHPAYPGGHATISGACATILKAFFNEDFVIPNPVVASADGLMLEPYSGPPLTVGGELNKLASNIAYGRDSAGLHWRSDERAGLKLGEEVAIGALRDLRATFEEEFSGFTLTKFDGTTIIV